MIRDFSQRAATSARSWVVREIKGKPHCSGASLLASADVHGPRCDQGADA